MWTDLVYAFFRADFHAKALQVAETGLSRFPEDSALTIAKADCLNSLRRTEEAVVVLDSFVAMHPLESKDAFLALARFRIDRAEQAEALKTLTQAIRLFPLASELLELKARILFEQGKYAQTVRIYRQLERLKPKNPSYVTLMGNALLELEFFGLAMEAYQRADNFAEHKQGWIIANIGNITNRRGFHALAIEHLENALSLEPGSVYTQERLVQAKQNRAAELRRLQSALAENPEEEYQDPGREVA